MTKPQAKKPIENRPLAHFLTLLFYIIPPFLTFSLITLNLISLITPIPPVITAIIVSFPLLVLTLTELVFRKFCIWQRLTTIFALFDILILTIDIYKPIGTCLNAIMAICGIYILSRLFLTYFCK